jgi:hypothetical protein
MIHEKNVQIFCLKKVGTDNLEDLDIDVNMTIKYILKGEK